MEYLEENEKVNGNSAAPIKSIPEIKGEEDSETIGWNVKPEEITINNGHSKDVAEALASEATINSVKTDAENDAGGNNSEEGNGCVNSFIEIKTYEEKTSNNAELLTTENMATSSVTECVPVTSFDLLSEIDSFASKTPKDLTADTEEEAVKDVTRESPLPAAT